MFKEREKFHRQKSLFIIIAALVLLFAIGGGVTYAALKAESSKLTNNFDAASDPSPTIPETFTPGGTVKEHVKVSLSNNAGESGKFFARASVLISFQDAAGNTVAKVPVENTDYTITMGDKWTKVGDYWYYNGTLVPGGQTTDLIVNCTTLSTKYKLVVDVISQTVQAKPTTAAQEAWGYVPSTEN